MLATAPLAKLNIAGKLAVINHIIQGQQNSIIPLLDIDNKMMRLSFIENEITEESITNYFSRWISVFDAPV